MGRLGPDRREGYRNLGVVEGYDLWACTYDCDPNPLIALEEQITLELAGDVAGRRILDLGCGTGRYCALLANRGASVIGVDPSIEMLERARRKISSSCSFELRHGTLENIHFPDEHFDLVLAALTLSHIPDLESIFAESARVLKRGGLMLVSDIHPYWAVSGHNYTEFFTEKGLEFRIPQYVHLVEDYWNLFRESGMRLEELREPSVDRRLAQSFPSLTDIEGIPLAIILKARRLRQ